MSYNDTEENVTWFYDALKKGEIDKTCEDALIWCTYQANELAWAFLIIYYSENNQFEKAIHYLIEANDLTNLSTEVFCLILQLTNGIQIFDNLLKLAAQQEEVDRIDEMINLLEEIFSTAQEESASPNNKNFYQNLKDHLLLTVSSEKENFIIPYFLQSVQMMKRKT